MKLALVKHEIIISDFGENVVLFVKSTGQTHILDAVVLILFSLLKNRVASTHQELLDALAQSEAFEEKNLLSQYFTDIITSLIDIKVIELI